MNKITGLRSLTTLGVIVTSLLLGQGQALAGHSHHQAKHHQTKHQQAKHHHAKTAYAKVIRSTPIYHNVAHKKHHKQHSATGIIVGGITGAAIGHALGNNHSDQHLVTIAGGVVGATIGHQISQAHHQTASHRQIIKGYRVTYKYKGQLYHTRMDHPPGRRIKIRA